METVCEVIWTGLLGRVKFLDLEISLANKVVIADHNTGDGREEDTVCGEVSGEVVGALKEIPWAHDKTDNGANVTTATDVEVSWEESSHIGSCGNRVCGDVCAELSETKCGSDEENTRSVLRATLLEE